MKLERLNVAGEKEHYIKVQKRWISHIEYVEAKEKTNAILIKYFTS